MLHRGYPSCLPILPWRLHQPQVRTAVWRQRIWLVGSLVNCLHIATWKHTIIQISTMRICFLCGEELNAIALFVAPIWIDLLFYSLLSHGFTVEWHMCILPFVWFKGAIGRILCLISVRLGLSFKNMNHRSLVKVTWCQSKMWLAEGMANYDNLSKKGWLQLCVNCWLIGI